MNKLEKLNEKKELEKQEALIKELLTSVTHKSHENWRTDPEERQRGVGTEKDPLRIEPRFKPANLKLDALWLIKNRRGYTKNGWLRNESLLKPEVNIAALTFNELPPSAQKESEASARYAIESVLRAAHNGTPLDERFIDATADTIHERWMARNFPQGQKDLEELRRKKDPESVALLKQREEQLRPYAKLTDKEKGKDREFVRLAIEAYKKQERQQQEQLDTQGHTAVPPSFSSIEPSSSGGH